MPHIAVHMYAGRNAEIKQRLAAKLQAALMEELGVDKSVVSVSITDVAKEQWPDFIKTVPQDDFYIRT